MCRKQSVIIIEHAERLAWLNFINCVAALGEAMCKAAACFYIKARLAKPPVKGLPSCVPQMTDLQLLKRI